MTKPGKPPSPAVRKRSLLRNRIHRATGVATGAVLLYLIGTGLPLQFTHTLDLGGRYVSTTWILDWYGVKSPESGWRSNGVSFVGSLVFFGDRAVAQADGFQGAVAMDDLYTVATDRALLLFHASDPDVVETLHLAAPVSRIGHTPDRVVLETGQGLQSLSPATLALEPGDPLDADVAWADLSTLTGTALAPLSDAARSRVLTHERLLQDLHSGRAFGAGGELLVSLASLALAVLAASGFWIWWRSR